MPLKQCRECGRKFDTESGDIEKRVAVTEKGPEYFVWVCTDCWDTMGGNIEFHEDKVTKYLCPYCPAVFATQQDLNTHLDFLGREREAHIKKLQRVRKEAERPGRYRKV